MKKANSNVMPGAFTGSLPNSVQKPRTNTGIGRGIGGGQPSTGIGCGSKGFPMQ